MVLMYFAILSKGISARTIRSFELGNQFLGQFSLKPWRYIFRHCMKCRLFYFLISLSVKIILVLLYVKPTGFIFYLIKRFLFWTVDNKYLFCQKKMNSLCYDQGNKKYLRKNWKYLFYLCTKKHGNIYDKPQKY